MIINKDKIGKLVTFFKKKKTNYMNSFYWSA